MYSKHSAMGYRILRINRNNDVILPLETNMASSWLKCREKEGILCSREDALLLISQQREQKKLFRGESSKKKACGS